jgi:hypothetical protein
LFSGNSLTEIRPFAWACYPTACTFPEPINAPAHPADRPSIDFQPVHDARLVWTPEVQGGPSAARHLRQLGIAFFEYCLAVPANRWGHSVYSAAELKTIQEVITLVVFAGFSVWVLKEPLGWNHAVGFGLIALGAWFIFQGKS